MCEFNTNDLVEVFLKKVIFMSYFLSDSLLLKANYLDLKKIPQTSTHTHKQKVTDRH